MCLIFKCNFCNKMDHLEPYCYAKLNDLKWSKENVTKPLRTNNTQGPKNIWVLKVKNKSILHDYFAALNELNENLLKLACVYSKYTKCLVVFDDPDKD